MKMLESNQNTSPKRPEHITLPLGGSAQPGRVQLLALSIAKFQHPRPPRRLGSDPPRGRVMFLAIAMFVLSFASNLSAQDKATLAWKFAKGDALTVQFKQTQSVLTRIDVRDRTLDSELVLVVDWKVLDVADDGNSTIEQTIDRIRLKTGAPGDEAKKVVDIDTASDAKLRGVSRDVMKEVKLLVGLKFNVVISTTGEVLSMTPGDNVAGAVNELPETSALRRVFSTAALARLIGDSMFVLPADAVGQGDSWDNDSTIAMTTNDESKLKFDRKVKSTVASVAEEKINIDVEVTLTQRPNTAAPVATALTSPLELQSFTGGGNAVFDRSVGAITSSTFNTQMKTRVIYRKDQIKTTTNVTNTMTVTRK
jgi:hypothetical protein